MSVDTLKCHLIATPYYDVHFCLMSHHGTAKPMSQKPVQCPGLPNHFVSFDLDLMNYLNSTPTNKQQLKQVYNPREKFKCWAFPRKPSFPPQVHLLICWQWHEITAPCAAELNMRRPLITKPQIPGPVFGVGGPTTTLIKRPIGPCCVSHSVGNEVQKICQKFEHWANVAKWDGLAPAKNQAANCLLHVDTSLGHHTANQLVESTTKTEGAKHPSLSYLDW